MIILGIDPGTARTGYGVIKMSPKLLWIAHGTIDTPKDMPTQERLLLLEQGLIKIFKEYTERFPDDPDGFRGYHRGRWHDAHVELVRRCRDRAYLDHPGPAA